jgi:hypothetical protein
MPETPITITNFSLASLRDVEDAYAQTYIVQNLVGIFLVQHIDDGLLGGQSEGGRLQSYCVLQYF